MPSMGSVFEWITVPRAADALEVSPRQVYKYIAKGQLTTRKEGKQTFVNRKDVKALIDCKKKGIPRAINAMTVLRMDTEIQVLKKQVETLMRLQDLRYETLDLQADELTNLHDMASHNLKVPWSPHEEAMWCDVFVKLRLEDLELMAQTEGYEDPWRPFLSLAQAMANHPHFPDNRILLSAGRDNLERIGFFWSQKMGTRSAKDLNDMLKADAKGVRKMDRKLEHAQQKKLASEE